MLLPQHQLTHALHVERQRRIEDYARDHALVQEIKAAAGRVATLARPASRPTRSHPHRPVGTGEVTP